MAASLRDNDQLEALLLRTSQLLEQIAEALIRIEAQSVRTNELLTDIGRNI